MGISGYDFLPRVGGFHENLSAIEPRLFNLILFEPPGIFWGLSGCLVFVLVLSETVLVLEGIQLYCTVPFLS